MLDFSDPLIHRLYDILKYFLPNIDFRNIFCHLGWQDFPLFPLLSHLCFVRAKYHSVSLCLVTHNVIEVLELPWIVSKNICSLRFKKPTHSAGRISTRGWMSWQCQGICIWLKVSGRALVTLPGMLAWNFALKRIVLICVSAVFQVVPHRIQLLY